MADMPGLLMQVQFHESCPLPELSEVLSNFCNKNGKEIENP